MRNSPRTRRHLILREDVEKLRSGSERLTHLNRRFSLSLDNLARATVRLYRHNLHLEAVERELRDCGAALVAAAGAGETGPVG